MGALQDGPVRATLIPAAFDNCDRTITALDSVLETLFSRLGPALNNQERPCDPTAQLKKGQSCAVVDRIDAISEKIDVIGKRVSSILQRIEL